jgi:transposase-like protein
MPQVQLPIFPEGVTVINQEIAFQRGGDRVTYFNGHLPVFTHGKNDLTTFRFFTTQLIINGTASQAEIIRAFGVPAVTVKRYVKLYREKGAEGFFGPKKARQGSKLKGEVLEQANGLLEEGRSVPEVAEQTGVLANTLHKAIAAGRLRRPAKKKS